MVKKKRKLTKMQKQFQRKEISNLNRAIKGLKRNKANLAKPLRTNVMGRGTLFTGRAEKEVDKAIRFLQRERTAAEKGKIF